MPLSLLWLAVGSFATGTALFMIAGLLPPIAADLSISQASAGHLVTAFALTIALASPLVAAATGGWERRRLLVLVLVSFAAANALAALAPDYTTLLLARVAIALAGAGFMPAATGYAIASVGPERRGRAISMVVGGLTLATVAGAPLGALVGEWLGWRAPFWAVAVLALVAALGTGLGLAPQAGSRAGSIAERLAVLRRPGVALLLAQGSLLIAGAFSIYTYFAPFLGIMLGFDSHGVALAILMFGLGAVVGNPMGGWMADRWPPRRIVAVALLLVGLISGSLSVIPALAPATVAGPVALGLIAIWGMVGWAYSVPQQTRLVRLAPELAPVLISFHASSTYLGTSVGALVGSGVLAAGQLPMLGWAGAALEFTGLLLLLSRPEPARKLVAA